MVGDVRIGTEVPLALDRVQDMMDTLGRAVRSTDARLWGFRGRDAVPEGLSGLMQGRKPVLKPSNPVSRTKVTPEDA